MIRNFIHFLIVTSGSIIWGVGNVCYTIMALLAVLANRIHPTTKHGNCWTFAIPLWMKYGGGLEIRAADGVKFLWIFPVLHVIYIAELPVKGVKMRQFVPLDGHRTMAKVFPYKTIYYKGAIRRIDSPHNAKSGWEEAVSKIHNVH